ncbi:hypothetical protein NF867_17555 [Solitalea sp. MAHUQ-68]|uniref:EF-hand domain-containing protein n=1 Tax=Solitalea agri TaxID=2953739 RepID=A0A9X2F4P9_9SPHI|nr:hypothetical protein [Solitalea agri]MCO4294672.1 hypothetical protein [Solitalea agri]
MGSKHFAKLLFIASNLFSLFSYGQWSVSGTLEGQFDDYNRFSIGSCLVSDMTVKYKLNTMASEPSVLLNFKWQAYDPDNDNCLSKEAFEMFIEVQVDGKYVYIPTIGVLGATPKGNNTWGYNPFASSPTWDKLFLLSVNGIKAGSTEGRVYVERDIAKNYWSSGIMEVTSILIIDRSGKKKSIQ